MQYSKEMQSLLGGDLRLGGFCHGRGITRRIAEGVGFGEFLKRFDDTMVVGQETIDNTPCYRLQAETPYGTIAVWIAPEKGYNALRLTWTSGDNDTVFPDGTLLKDSPLEESSLLMDSIEVQEIDGVFIPVSGRLIGVEKRRDRTVETHSFRVTFAQVDLKPDFEALGAFKVLLPDGTPIGDRDHPGVNYEVIGGKLVPHSVSPHKGFSVAGVAEVNNVNAATGSNCSGGKGWSRPVLVGVILLGLGTGVVCVVLYRRQRQR